MRSPLAASEKQTFRPGGNGRTAPIPGGFSVLDGRMLPGVSCAMQESAGIRATSGYATSAGALLKSVTDKKCFGATLLPLHRRQRLHRFVLILARRQANVRRTVDDP